jgi:hypothetical protein
VRVLTQRRKGEERRREIMIRIKSKIKKGVEGFRRDAKTNPRDAGATPAGLLLNCGAGSGEMGGLRNAL